MSGDPHLSEELNRRIFDAARVELLEVGIDRFRIDGVARRAGLDPAVITANWHDRRVLLMEVMLARTVAGKWSPDTGSVYTDLEALSKLAAESSRNATDRALFRRVLPSDDDADLAEIIPDLWNVRFQAAAQLLVRAADRGQLRDGVVPDDAIRMFAAALYFDVIFADAPVRPEYGDQVLDIFLHGVVGAAGRDRPWAGLEQLLEQTDSVTSGSSAADHAVESARRAAVLMRAWADALLDPVMLYEAARDRDGQVVDFVVRDINQAACAEVGLRRSEALGITLLSSVPVRAAPGMMEVLRRCLDLNGPLVLNDYLYEDFDRQRWLDVRAARAGAELVTVTWRDVTDRREAAKRDQRYRKLMDHSAVPAVLVTPDGRFVLVNQAMATLVGYDIDTLLTMTWQELTPAETVDEELAIVAEMVAGRRDTWRGLKHYFHAAGHRVEVDVTVSCIRGPDGELEHLIAQIIDVTRYLSGREPDGE